MKALFIFIILTGTIMVLATSCKKLLDAQPRLTFVPNPPTLPINTKLTRVTFLEYGSYIPVQDVELKGYKCDLKDFGICSNSHQIYTWKSDKNGMIEVTEQQYKDSIFAFDITRTNYSFPNIVVAFGNSMATLADTLISYNDYDSAVVRLFPDAWIRLHIKDSASYNNREMVKSIINIVRPVPRVINLPAFLPENQPASNLDTVLIYKTFGNVNTQIYLELLDSAKRSIKNTYSGMKFVSKGDTLTWNINY